MAKSPGFWSLLLGLSLVVACSGERARPAPADLPVHKLVFGGDIILGRWLNDALHDEARRADIFGDVAPLLRDAEIAVANAEGVISIGGTFTDKGEPRPIMYRAHPLAAELLAGVGIDVLTVGNNHTGDFGREAFSEMLDRIRLFDMDYAGGGRDPEDAARAAYLQRGDLVVAVIGVDLTNTTQYAVKKGKPGTYVLDGRSEGQQNEVFRRLSRRLAKAREHADVVILSPHWGDNWREEPDPLVRSLARRLIRAGYDAILGHSAHLFQGIELIDGKPVVYDAGNLLLDYPGQDAAHDGLLVELDLNKAGVVSLQARPLDIGASRVRLAQGEKAREVVKLLVERSEKLGTRLETIDNGTIGRLMAEPGGLEGPVQRAPLQARPKPSAPTEAPRDVFVERLPATAQPLNLRFPGGVELLGWEMLLKELPKPKSGNIVTLFFRADRPQERGLLVRVEARGQGAQGQATSDVDRHLPGNWNLPAEQWPVGQIVADATLLRLQNVKDGEVSFLMGLERGERLIPDTGAHALVDGSLVPLGKATYRKGSKGIFRTLAELKRTGGKQASE